MSKVPMYRGVSLIRNSLPLGSYSRPVPRALKTNGDPREFGRFL